MYFLPCLMKPRDTPLFQSLLVTKYSPTTTPLSLTVTGTVANEPATLMVVQVYPWPVAAELAVAGMTSTIATSMAPTAAVRSTRRNVFKAMMPPRLLLVGEGVGSDQISEDRGASSEAHMSQLALPRHRSLVGTAAGAKFSPLVCRFLGNRIRCAASPGFAKLLERDRRGVTPRARTIRPSHCGRGGRGRLRPWKDRADVALADRAPAMMRGPRQIDELGLLDDRGLRDCALLLATPRLPAGQPRAPVY